jgi:hypothetical protein
LTFSCSTRVGSLDALASSVAIFGAGRAVVICAPDPLDDIEAALFK